MKPRVTVVFLLFLCGVSIINSSRILMVFNHYGKSHYIQAKALGKGLARAGHDVTLVSPFEDTEKVKGFSEIVLDGLMKDAGIDVNFMRITKVSPALIHVYMIPHFNMYTDLTLNNKKFQNLLKSDQKFDVIILEDLYNGALRGLAWHYKAPLILFNPFSPTVHLLDLAGNPAPPSYVPSIWIGYPHHMTFWQRSMNTFFTLLEYWILHFRNIPSQQGTLEKYFPGSPNLELINKYISLFLLNDHESINSPTPSVPNMINILGFHLKTEHKLPKDLQEFMDGAKDGMILFSFGSYVNPSNMDDKIKQAFLKSLGKLKQKVLWKTDEEIIPGKPENIKLSKWVPQEDILAHYNCKLFLTHAGFVSTIETTYHAVPVLAVPLAGDQLVNAARMVELGIGLSTTYDDITEEKLDVLIKELLSNNTYLQNVKKRSELLKDRPVKPMDLAIYWVEYVIRHKDLSHMRVAALDLKWYQYFLLDVVLVWTLVAVAVIFLMYTVLKTIFSMCRRKKKVKLT